MPLREPLRPARATALRVVLPPPHSREFVLQPLTFKQVSDALELDPRADAPKETERERMGRMCAQAEILLGPEHCHLTALLTPVQIGEITTALYLLTKGIDPTNFHAVQQHMREQQTLARTAEEAKEILENLALDLAAAPGGSLKEVDTMPVADGVALHLRRQEKEAEAAKFNAALHGIS